MAISSHRCARLPLMVGLTLVLIGCGPTSPPSPMSPPIPTTDPAAPGVAAPDASAPLGAAPDAAAPSANRLVPVVLATYPHDPTAFTQGLVLDGDVLLESTGLEGQSTLREVDLESGNVLRRHDVPPDVFAEGLALVDGTLFQLSWQEERAFTYDRTTFAPQDERSYDGEGWGLCYDGQRLVMSDGSDRLTFRDPATFAPAGEVSVTLDGAPLQMLNELECVGDRVYANVWQTNLIVAIDPASGRVADVIDASALRQAVDAGTPSSLPIDVLNGIAFDPADETFLLTGKLWPKLFRVGFAPAGAPAFPTSDPPASGPPQP